MHYVLLGFSRHVARFLNTNGHEVLRPTFLHANLWHLAARAALARQYSGEDRRSCGTRCK